MKAYCSAVSEITIDSITAKKFARLPLEIVKTRMTNTEPTPAEARFMAIGVPLLENLPSTSGAEPSRPATAWQRAAPCSHTPPALTMMRMIMTPMSQPTGPWALPSTPATAP